jgi:hypothetical protein
MTLNVGRRVKVYGLGTRLDQAASHAATKITDQALQQKFTESYRRNQDFIVKTLVRLGAPADKLAHVKHARITRSNHALLDFEEKDQAADFMQCANPPNAAESCFRLYKWIRVGYEWVPKSRLQPRGAALLAAEFEDLVATWQAEAQQTTPPAAVPPINPAAAPAPSSTPQPSPSKPPPPPATPVLSPNRAPTTTGTASGQPPTEKETEEEKREPTHSPPAQGTPQGPSKTRRMAENPSAPRSPPPRNLSDRMDESADEAPPLLPDTPEAMRLY